MSQANQQANNQTPKIQKSQTGITNRSNGGVTPSRGSNLQSAGKQLMSQQRGSNAAPITNMSLDQTQLQQQNNAGFNPSMPQSPTGQNFGMQQQQQLQQQNDGFLNKTIRMDTMYSDNQSDMQRNSGERIQVAVRCRPLQNHERQRGDENVVSCDSATNLTLTLPGSSQKQFRLNAVLNENSRQIDVFQTCGVHELINSALDGYSATIFAYGQTGSGKTFTMMGDESTIGQENWQPEWTNDGLFLQAVRYMWESMTMREEQFYVKASFAEIYNEQMRDLLNPSSGILQVRWNVKNGFFVEDLMVVECTGQDDIVAVLHEGMKNRHQGSHALNQDSSRSHSLLTVYLISETRNPEDGHVFKKYGKMTFVDLAGSERLKETKAKEEHMVKEAGNINKSLFTLGKVISMLSSPEKKINQKYIPYRDSKLTMLLMDSLGGTSKALMIACISPSAVYSEETLSTLNYACRAMNIKNKPVLQMDAKEQIIYNLKREIKLLRIENEFLQSCCANLNGGKPILIPQQLIATAQGQLTRQQERAPSQVQGGLSTGQAQGGMSAQPMNNMGGNPMQPSQGLINEFQSEINRLRQENGEIRYAKELKERDFESVMFENQTLYTKLDNLESVFIGTPLTKDTHTQSGKQKFTKDYQTSTLLVENNELRRKIAMLEQENIQMKMVFQSQQPPPQQQDQTQMMGTPQF